MSLLSVLKEVKKKGIKTDYAAMPVKDKKGIFVGLDRECRPCVFIESEGQEGMPSIRTAQIKVEFSRKYKLLMGSALKKEGIFHGILCLSRDQNDKSTFIDIMDSLLKQPNNVFSTESINRIFHSLVNLFSVKPSANFIHERRGLWAELYFMKKYHGSKFWFPYWHSEPTRVYDFSKKSKRTEIKCTISDERIHEFSHKQLFGLPFDDIRVVSLMLQEDDAGISLRSLIDEAKQTLSGSPHYIKLEKEIRRVGMSDPEEEGPKFNETYAARHIAWFKASEVPRFTTEEPAGVSGTRYKSDLTTANRLSPQEIEEWINGWEAHES